MSKTTSLFDQTIVLVKKTGKLLLLAPTISLLFYLFLSNGTAKIPPNIDGNFIGFVTLPSLMLWIYILKVMSKKINDIFVDIFLIFCIILGIVLYLVNGILYDKFIYVIPTNQEKILLGCGWNEQILPLLGKYFLSPTDNCPGNFKYILESAQFESSYIWTTSSLQWIEIFFSIIWFVIPISFAAFFSIFIIKTSYIKSKSNL